MNKAQLRDKLNNFDIPESRKDLDNFGNICWLIRNIGIRNSKNSELKSVIMQLVQIKKQFDET